MTLFLDVKSYVLINPISQVNIYMWENAFLQESLLYRYSYRTFYMGKSISIEKFLLQVNPFLQENPFLSIFTGKFVF